MMQESITKFTIPKLSQKSATSSSNGLPKSNPKPSVSAAVKSAGQKPAVTKPKEVPASSSSFPRQRVGTKNSLTSVQLSAALLSRPSSSGVALKTAPTAVSKPTSSVSKVPPKTAPSAVVAKPAKPAVSTAPQVKPASSTIKSAPVVSSVKPAVKPAISAVSSDKRPIASKMVANRVSSAPQIKKTSSATPSAQTKRSESASSQANSSSRKPEAKKVVQQSAKPKANTMSYEELMRIAERNAQRNSERDDYAELVLAEAKRREEADRAYLERKKARNGQKQKPGVPPTPVSAAASFTEAEMPKKTSVAKDTSKPKLAEPSSYVANLFKLSRPGASAPQPQPQPKAVQKPVRATKVVMEDTNQLAEAQEDFDDYDDDDDMDSFIDDSTEPEAVVDPEVQRELAAVLKSKFRYDANRFKDEPVGNLRWMESNYRQITKEERESSRAGAREDEEELKQDLMHRELKKRKATERLFGAAKRAK